MRSGMSACAAGAAVACGAGLARADGAFATYGQLYRTMAMPATGLGSSGLMGEALPDGRLLAVTGNSILMESGVGTGVFAAVATFDPAQSGGASDPAFVRLSPDGTRVAVGLGFGKPVAVVPLSALGTPGSPATLTAGGASRYYNVPHYDGAWADNSHLGITSGNFGSPGIVSVLDVASPTTTPVNPTVLSGIGGASAGIAFDSAGRLFTGNGFDLGPGGSSTGTIRAFERTAWDGAVAATPFETGGVLVADVLSANSLLFDRDGNLVVGGGDFDEFDVGYLAVLRAGALAGALAGLGPVDRNSADVLRLTPSGDPFAFYGSAFNGLTGELYATVTNFSTGANTWYATVPGPGGAALVLVGSALLTARRRRHA